MLSSQFIELTKDVLLIVYFYLPCALSLVLRFVQNGRTSTFNYTSNGLSISFDDKAKCMPTIGCFSAGAPFFHPISRPVSLLPQDRDEVGIQFFLYTRKNPLYYQTIKAGDINNILKTNFLLETETKIIVSGWMDSIKVSTWMQDMKDALLNYGDINVIIVDWSKSNGIPFALAVANTRVVGAEIALMVNFLQDSFGVLPESCHIIGHSLGTEIAGYAGERITNLGRITALDPAGPFFRNVSTEVRLDPSDALFVDAIHAHSSDIDLDKPSRLQQTGHIDFYPNGGENQPGCPTPLVNTFVKKGVLEGARNLIVCDHYRAIDYFLATIPNHYGCQPIGIACDSWKKFQAGRCSDCLADGSQCAVMGFQANIKQLLIKQHPPKKFYLYTSAFPPFCVQQYHVSVKLKNTVLIHKIAGDIEVTLKGRFGSITVKVNKRNRMISPGAVYKTIAASNEDIDLNSATFHWTVSPIILTEKIKINVQTPEKSALCLHSIIVTVYSASPINPGKQIIFCGPESPIQAGFEFPLKPGNFCTSDL